jgi:hypothetical protein
MSEIRDTMGRLHLVGYEKLTDHGLALPIFGRSQGANIFYTARSTLPGEANGQIAQFNRYNPEAPIRLPLERIRETGVGEPWLDVFLWEGATYVGTAPEIWNALAEVRESIAEHAPLSLLALAEGVERAPNLQLVHKAFSWLTERYGRKKALEWRTDTYLRRALVKGLRRDPGASIYDAKMRRGLREELMVSQHDNKVIASIGFLPIDDFQAFVSVVESFGLERELIIGSRATDFPSGGHRTSELTMRIAALQVAASKPHGKATTSELKKEVAKYLILTPKDLLPSQTRPNEAMYQQIVGNIVSHRGSKNNIFARGWATYTGDGIQITEAGRHYLRTLGLQS